MGTTAPGRLKAAKDDWDIKLTRRGHDMRWSRTASKRSYSGRCVACGGQISVGASWSSSSGKDIRDRRCGRAGIFRRIIGG